MEEREKVPQGSEKGDVSPAGTVRCGKRWCRSTPTQRAVHLQRRQREGRWSRRRAWPGHRPEMAKRGDVRVQRATCSGWEMGTAWAWLDQSLGREGAGGGCVPLGVKIQQVRHAIVIRPVHELPALCHFGILYVQ